MSTIATTVQRADSITIELIGIYFTTATDPIPLKAEASANRLGTETLCSPRLGNISTTSTPSRPLSPPQLASLVKQLEAQK
jgi:hypothetical protein